MSYDALLSVVLVSGSNDVQVGTVHSTHTSQDDEKTLKHIKFQTGDYMDVSIRTPVQRSGAPGRDDARRNGSSRGLPSRRK